MNLLKSPCFIFFLFWFSLSPVFSSPSSGGQVSRQSAPGKVEKEEGKRHRLTGKVSKVDVREGIVHVKGRKGELSFRVGPETVKSISPGEKVRVYYITTPDKKMVVRRIKKINNGVETTGGEKGRKGRGKREQ
jgi:hypothetical protein